MYVTPCHISWMILTLNWNYGYTDKLMGENYASLVAYMSYFATREISWFLFLLTLKQILLKHLAQR